MTATLTPSDVGQLVQYYRFGEHYGRLVAVNGTKAKVLPSSKKRSIEVPLEDVKLVER